MNSFTVELVSNASFDCYPNNTLSFLQTFFRNKLISKENGRLQLQNYLILPCTKTSRKEFFFYPDETTPNTKPSNYYTLDPGLYSSISDIVNEMNKKDQKRKNYEKNTNQITR